jgi:hypothetical protein
VSDERVQIEAVLNKDGTLDIYSDLYGPVIGVKWGDNRDEALENIRRAWFEQFGEPLRMRDQL